MHSFHNMKKIISMLLGLTLAFSAQSQSTLERVMPTTSAFGRQILTNETAAQWAALILLGTNYNFGNFAFLNGTNYFYGTNTFSNSTAFIGPMLISGSNIFTGSNYFAGATIATNASNVFAGDGSGLKNLPITSNSFSGILAITNGGTGTNSIPGISNVLALQGMANQPTNGPDFSSPNIGGNSTYASQATLNFGLYSQLYINDAHSGTGEMQWTFGRLALLPAYGSGYNGAIQIGAAYLGAADGSHALFYLQNSKYAASSGDPLGYGYTWLEFYNWYGNAMGNGGAVAHRSEGIDTNGSGRTAWYYPTFNGWSGGSLDFGPTLNEPVGKFIFSIDSGTLPGSTGLTYAGHLTRAVSVNSPFVTNYGVNFDSTNEIVLNIAQNINLTNIPGAFPRTNQSDTVDIYIYPGLASFNLTVPPTWNTNPAFSGTVSNSTITRLITRRQVVQGATNYFVDYIPYPYTPYIDTNAQNFFNAVTNGGGSLSANERAQVNQLCINMKNDGSWYSNDVIYPFVGGTTNSMCWNLVNTNTFRLSFHGTYTTNSFGITGDGSSAYVDTSFIPSSSGTTYTVNNASVSIYNYNALATGRFMGAQDSIINGHSTQIGSNGVTQVVARINNNTDGVVNISSFDGFFTATCSPTTFYIYAPGGGSASNPQAPAASPSVSFYLLARNASGTADSFGNPTINYASFGGYKSPALQAAESADVTAFETALGRK